MKSSIMAGAIGLGLLVGTLFGGGESSIYVATAYVCTGLICKAIEGLSDD